MRCSTRFVFAVAGIASLLLLSLPAAAQDASWLDGDFENWNSAGMEIPAAPEIDGNLDPRCVEHERVAETPEDDAVRAAGWRLYLAYQRGWGVTVISGLASYDSMCRPLGYQTFVFVDGEFAGTISPEPMNARTDGSASNVTLWFEDQITADFARYTAEDPECCPSSTTTVEYTIERTDDGPVLAPVPPQ